ncbi:protein-disulfide isomerase [Sagittula marina]|uniref:Protein-disulfide isomerase n=1 Tax=Sagittula marina TaxID=943940 RepID=A0A7W6DQR0_9RHOB|nr:DsbA family protein [Sagittula marina]MBB3985197.1 protein-disulfide isomerase [Sagittula marina]
MSKTLLKAGVTAACLLGATTASAQDAFDIDNMTDTQRAAFGEAVRDYLLENPQTIMDAVSKLEEMEAQQQIVADQSLVETHREALLDDGYSWVGGNPDGDFTIVEFMDYRCGYCRKAAPEVTELVENDGNIRLIVKEFPILGEASLESSKFAIATQIVAGDEAYGQVHDALIALEGNPSESALTRLADTFGLDGEAILAEMNSDEVMRRISETRALAQAMQISGTPSFVFGDEMVRGYAPLPAMEQIVAQARASE